MDEDEGPFGATPEPAQQPIPWESGPGGWFRRFFATQLALLAPSSLVKAFGEGNSLPALRYALLVALLVGALRVPEWTLLLQFTSLFHVLAEGRAFVTVARGAGATDVVLDVLRAWGLGTAVHVAIVAALAASYASIAQSFDPGTRSVESAARRRESLLRAALYLSATLLLALVLRAVLVLGVGIGDRLLAELTVLPAVFVLLRGLRATAVEHCKVSGGGTLAVTIVPVVLLLSTQMVLVDRLLAPLLPPIPSPDALAAADQASDAPPRRRTRDAGAALEAGPAEAGAGDAAAALDDASARGAPGDASLAAAAGETERETAGDAGVAGQLGDAAAAAPLDDPAALDGTDAEARDAGPEPPGPEGI